MLQMAAPGRGVERWHRVARAGVIAVCLLVAVVALDPKLPDRVGIDLTGLEAEGIMAAVLLFVGANFAWFLMASPPQPPPPGG
jgi:hypothetical protein